jgi:pyruvate formate lyase activating enzyme
MEARHYKKLEGQEVQCLLCPHACRLKPGEKGRCRLRTNVGGILEASAYGHLVSLAMDPIEKKPLYHFHPGSHILSTGPNGCNLSCRFCQNWEISQTQIPTARVDPAELVQAAKSHQSIGIAYTYTEPLVWFEYLMDACALARESGLANVLVTNGYVNPGPLQELLPLVDAMNIDLKSMEPDFYRRICGGELEPVLGTIEKAHGRCLVELTNLVIPGLNDSPQQQVKLIDWVAGLDKNIPLHLSRYFPQYQMRQPATPELTLIEFANRAREKLHYVYVGNIRLPDMADTRCPGCGRVLVNRQGYQIRISGLKDGACRNCGRRADIIGI